MLSLILLPAHGIPIPELDCLVGPQWERMCLVLVGIDVPGWGGTRGGGFSLSEEKGRGYGRGEIYKGRTGKSEGNRQQLGWKVNKSIHF